MKTQLPIFEKKFKELTTRMKNNLVTTRKGQIFILNEKSPDYEHSEYRYAVDHLVQISGKIRRDFKNFINTNYTVSDEYKYGLPEEDIIDSAIDSIYQYDFELNKMDNHREVIIGVVDNLFRFYFRLLIRNEQIDPLYEYVIQRNIHHLEGNYDEYACDPTGRIKGRENKGIADISYFTAAIDLIMEDLTHPISYAFEPFDEKYTLFSFILTGETNIEEISE